MELCNESFQSFLQSAGDELTERAYSRIFGELLAGLSHVHGKGVVHRDIKPDNVMVGGGIAKLCDFGLAGVLPPFGSAGLSGICGTAPFMAPEMLNRETYRTEVDVWSMGVVAYTFFYGEFPYMPKVKTPTEIKRMIRDGTTLPSFQAWPLPAVSEEAETLVRALLNRSKEARIDAATALQFKFIRKGPSSEEKLPSLQPTFRICLKCGIFENRQVDKLDGNLDPLLDTLHRRHTGSALVQDAVKAPSKLRFSQSTWSDASTAASSGMDGCHQVPHVLGQPTSAW
jgi:serine/threonine protein kinase